MFNISTTVARVDSRTVTDGSISWSAIATIGIAVR